ncbi:MAG TPA: mannose-1-phosphate guanylyltransferase [Anaerolineales bacterium]|nr:mannose-1-phosphate guanylyltransferase [Anaerolineales bacterium]
MYYAVIMAGGSGTRLWPLSRRSRSKQSLKLVGDRTMFQHAVDRLAPLFQPEQIFVVTREDQSALLSAQVPELPAANFIKEPVGRGTAPAIGLAAIHLKRIDPDATMAVLTADHYITDTEQFRKALKAAALMAQDGHLVTLGIKPAYPSTGFGYIQQGPGIRKTNTFQVFRVERFIEKPGVEAARQMLASGNYSWNSGMFVWRAERILMEFQRQMPELYGQLMQVEAALGKPETQTVLAQVWKKVTEQTIDYGVMEHAENVVVIPVDIGWTDVGNWASLAELLPTDQDGNIFVGPYKEIDTHNTLVFGGKRLIATIGIQDVVIVDSEDALLVCAKNREQEVRDIVEKLKANGDSQWL